MSNSNYMDNVPVKIAEKYKPPPRIYQLPQSVVNKLCLPDRHFEESPQFFYDFQLERKVLAKIPEWRRMRQGEREARQARKEKREEENLRRIEEQQKELLGAVSYPNAAELSSSDSDEEDSGEKVKETTNVKSTPNDEVKFLPTRNWSFNNILQPTIVNQHINDDNNTDSNQNNSLTALLGLDKQKNNVNSPNHHQQQSMHSNNASGHSGNKQLVNTFNYKDFEEDTSSPFDNIELKTINDLDILAQVLHNTQLKAFKNNDDNSNVEKNDDGLPLNNTKEKSDEEILTEAKSNPAPTLEVLSDISILENTKTALEKVNFGDINISLPQQNDTNIPTETAITHNHHQGTIIDPLPRSSMAENHFGQRNFGYESHHQNYLHLNNSNGFPLPTHASVNEATNYNNIATYYGTPPPMHYLLASNANNCLQPTSITEEIKHSGSYHSPISRHILHVQEIDQQQSTKSKSVPDILRELRDEVRNSEMRRKSRNCTNNFCENTEVANQNEKKDECRNLYDQPETESYNKLGAPIQKLATNISSMGFPLERVVKIAQIYGEDDKKIIEHLIPLTELLDLGFEENLISEALVKFDNNKEKALEHLIS